MGLFDGLKRRKEKSEPTGAEQSKAELPKTMTETAPAMDHGHDGEIIEIAGLLSYQDEKVINEVKECLSDAEAYFAAYPDVFDGWTDFPGEWEACRTALLHFLEQGNYVCIRDWKDEKEDFIYFVQQLEGFKRSDLSLEEDWLKEDGAIGIWSGILDGRWKDKDRCLAAVDNDSDEYVLFICDGNTLKRLQELSEATGYHIGPAKNM